MSNIILTPLITIVGVGGGGCNALNNLISSGGLSGVKFIAMNTDAQSLSHSLADVQIQLGPKTTLGLGAGSIPEVGIAAAEESEEEIRKCLEDSHMVFITAGMGGGTGTGASQVVAKITKEMGILSVAVVTKPFEFEGKNRFHIADKGIEELQKSISTLIVIKNQNLFSKATERTTFKDAFEMADGVLYEGIKGITELIMGNGLINLDFADVKAIMSVMGNAMIGTGEASEEDRAVKAAEIAINNSLLEQRIRGAKQVLVNITGGIDLTLHEVDGAVSRIREEVGNNEANIIFGSTFDEKMNDKIKVLVLATGIADEIILEDPKENKKEKEHLSGQSILNDIEKFEQYNLSEIKEEAVHNIEKENKTVLPNKNIPNKNNTEKKKSENDLSDGDIYDTPAFFRKHKKTK